MDSKGSQHFAEGFSPTVGRCTRRLAPVYGRKWENRLNRCDLSVAYLVISKCKQIQKKFH
ncbi:MAG: hypothetical protein LBC20_17545 [Planctomycetaceae bacterium]|nr:hypothetical protein [Planctomycetaceae bacterium]